MTGSMGDGMRSLTVLSLAFVGAVAITIGISMVVIPAAVQVGPVGGAPSSEAPVATPIPGAIPGLGGALEVSGDRDGTMHLSNPEEGTRYALVGPDARMVFDGVPASVVQVSYDGLEFFPDPGDCTIELPDLEGALGIGFVELECRGLTDVRGNGTIDLVGELGMPLDLLRDRQFPPSGGSLAVGDETWEFSEAELSTWQLPARAGVRGDHLILNDPNRGTLSFHYDLETLQLVPGSVIRHGAERELGPDACSFEREELGQHNPRTLVIELTISCPAVEVPGLGTVPVRGTIVVDQYLWPL